jgi:hypothetical protein
VADQGFPAATRTPNLGHNHLIHTGFRFQPEPGVFHVLNLNLGHHCMDIAKSMPERAVRMKVRTLSQVMEGRAFNLLRLKYAEGLTDAQIGQRVGLPCRQVQRLRVAAEQHVGRMKLELDLVIDLDDPPPEAGF